MTKTRELSDYLEYKKQEAIVKETLKIEAKTCWQAYCSELTEQTKLGSVRSFARKMNGIAPYSSIPTLKYNGFLAETNLKKANILAKNYAKTSNTENYNDKCLHYIKKNNSQKNAPGFEIDSNHEIEMLNVKFDISELKQAIRSAKNNKSPGDDKVPYELLKFLHQNALETLLSFYNEIWTEGKMPADWHHAIILPLLKPNKDASAPESYRPKSLMMMMVLCPKAGSLAFSISLTSTFCKVMEAMVNKRLLWFLEKNKII